MFISFLSEMATVSSRPSALDTSVDIETDTDYLKIAKKGGGHKGKGIALIELTDPANYSDVLYCQGLTSLCCGFRII